MSFCETASVLEPYQVRCEDQVAVIAEGDRTILVVADGAGGSGDGFLAAQTVIQELTAAISQAATADAWERTLAQVDLRIGAGEATGVVVDLRADRLCGASVGDSQAWLIHNGEIVNLTAHQRRKPLLGSGSAVPVGFERREWDGLLLVATDGFCNYVNRGQLTAALPYLSFSEIPRKLVEMVRLNSGELWDDVGIVACRRAGRAKTTKKHYVIDPDQP